MKAIKGLLVYIGIIIAVLFIVCFAIFGFMYFFPTFRLFGIGVIHADEQSNIEKIIMSEYSGYDNIELNLSSNKININVVTVEDSQDISYNLDLSVFGISTDITEYRIIRSVDVKDRILKINLSVTEPNGWISNNSSYMNIKVPANKSYDILTKTQSGSVSLGQGETALKCNKLTVNTKGGNLNIGSLAESGVLNLEALNLTTTSGKMDFSSINTINVANKMLINANRGYFKFNNINADIDVRGTGVEISAQTIKCPSTGLTFMAENGTFNVKSLNSLGGAENTIVTEYGNVNIEKVIGDTGIITTYGNINIGIAKDDLILESTHGKIDVVEVSGDIRASSHYGDINVQKYFQSGNFVSEQGEIRVESAGDYEHGRVTKIKSKDGNVFVINKVNQLNLNITGTAKAEIKFTTIKTGLTDATTYQNTIKTGTHGRCELYLPVRSVNDDLYFKFTAKGNITGALSGLEGEYLEHGMNVVSKDEPQYYPNKDAEVLWFTCCSFYCEGNIHFGSH